MPIAEDLALFIIKFIQTIKEENLEWRKAKQDEIAAYQHKKAMLKRQLEEDLTKREVRFRAELERIELEERRQTEDYKAFLGSIDELKERMLASFAHMPKPLALLIHHHAKQLLNDMWYDPDMQDRLKSQLDLQRLLVSLNEDLAQIGSGDGAGAARLPQRTLEFIDRSAAGVA